MPVHTQSPEPVGANCADDELDCDPQPSHAPRVKAQFFYVSSLPIDDPLSPLPPIPTDKTVKLPPQPFSVRDNSALEKAWQAFQQDVPGAADSGDGLPSPGGDAAVSKTRPLHDSSRRTKGGEENRRRTLDESVTLQVESEVLLHDTRSGRTPEDESSLQEQHSQRSTLQEPTTAKQKRRLSPHRALRRHRRSSQGSSVRSFVPNGDQKFTPPSAGALESDISGRPFARAPSGEKVNATSRDGYAVFHASDSEDGTVGHRSRSPSVRGRGRKQNDHRQVFVPVGVSRLHLVELPDLVMKPIYWSPINDESSVIRATWFYKDSMLPVPAEVANRLEVGYEYMMPYAESYQEELQACIEYGASAEMKVVHPLWSDEPKPSRPTTAVDLGPSKLGDVSTAAHVSHIPETAENAAADPRRAGETKRLFATHSVIYTDARNAQILRPNLLPSITQNRRPLSAIRKGRQIGVAVVRGFDRRAWLKIHPDPKPDAKSTHAAFGAYKSRSGDAATRGSSTSCAACDQGSDTAQVTDLVLVIHGIGQKLSERVDSFHFTHAINGLRREFNVELSSETVKGTLRPEAGIMVLPVNWRLTVSFDDDVKSGDGQADNTFALKDVTPDTLPGVRSLISDVMLDIPYYLSHHKDKMIAAVIREANRVYRLWCRNNPGFDDDGRVHLIAHSLGSVMAMEILSRQPTKIAKAVTTASPDPSDTYFEFDTTNLFSCGSPAGFFLLLNNASLVPRKGRDKMGMEGEDRQPGIAGEAQFGCLAVDNLYNICHRNDPISYLQNAAVDQAYAASLQTPAIPSASLGWIARLGTTLRWTSAHVPDAYSTTPPPIRPELQHIPSTVELDTHDFSREEIAEKRMYLLNDNGQIDWFLNSGGGPLEIQYLNMLSAHSSYWILQDFVRFLVVEIGREPGRQHTLPVLRAVKKREYKRGHMH